MSNYDLIIKKLESFIRKYYTNDLIKGSLFFLGIGLFYFLLIVGLEYLFWLPSKVRVVLFWAFIGVESLLFFRFILFPLAKLFRLSKGISYTEASKIIGQHFPEVNDKLVNILQLKEQAAKLTSDLLLASIEQKSIDLKPIPFQLAINFKNNLKYAAYVLLPVLVIVGIYLSGSVDLFSDSYKRVVNYQKEYTPPAPFQFMLLNDTLNIHENQDFTLQVKTTGNLIPQQAKIHIDDKTYVMKTLSPGVFSYTFQRVKQQQEFKISANEVFSIPYQLSVTKVPSLVNFEMNLAYPAYVQQKNKNLIGTGNATIPEGTKVSWKVTTKNTDTLAFITTANASLFNKSNNLFTYQKPKVKNSFTYTVASSNTSIHHYEKLTYQLKVLKDQYPKIDVKVKRDSIDNQQLYFFGNASDDYGISSVALVYYPIDNQSDKKIKTLSVPKAALTQFTTAFPGNLALTEGTSYEMYFVVKDNDGVNGAKQTKSKTFSFRKFSKKEKEEVQLKEQQESIHGMDNALKQLEENKQEYKKIEQLQKEKTQYSYQDRKKVQQYLDRQKEQEQLMQKFSEQLKKNLEEFKEENKDDFQKTLENRLEKQKERAKENEKLIDELEKYQDKINKDRLDKGLEKLAKNQQVQQKDLEQLLELTKRFYVEEKAKKLSEDLQDIAKKQEALAKNDSTNTKEKQAALNKDFEKFQKELDALEEENSKLKEPMELGRDKPTEAAAEEDQKAAEKLLEEQEQSGNQSENSQKNAQQKQQSAADKMKQMSLQMQQMQMEAEMEQQEEDAAMLKQVLDNLIAFSFQQEDLMQAFRAMEENSPNFAQRLRKQHALKQNFKFIDDSLYALAARNPLISEKVTEKLVEVTHNIDEALDDFAQNRISQGIASQQFAFKATNDLANLLDQSLDQMQMQMNAMGKGSSGKGKSGQGKSGSGKGKGFQLPDIIKKQQELSNQMQQGNKSGGSKGEGKEKGEQGSEGSSSKGSKEGKSGKSGASGEGNKGGKEGSLGEEGEEQSRMLYEIYKEQQQLRFQLENMLKELGNPRDANMLLEEMKTIEDELLRNGYNEQTRKRMLRVEHKLMQLNEAALEQEQERKREAESAKMQHQSKLDNFEEKAKEYFNTTEILNRHSLPLQPIYKEKVNRYFQIDND